MHPNSTIIWVIALWHKCLFYPLLFILIYCVDESTNSKRNYLYEKANDWSSNSIYISNYLKKTYPHINSDKMRWNKDTQKEKEELEKGRVRGMKEERQGGRPVDVNHGIVCYNGKTKGTLHGVRTLTLHSDNLDSNCSSII